MVFAFLTLDLFYFYFFFESILFPLYILIIKWGSRERKVVASYFLFFFTFIGSLLFLFAIFLIRFWYGTTNLLVLQNILIDSSIQKYLWWCFFFAFAVKVPIVPLHLWLPEAHVEAPTAGSVILAGLVLKLSGYGFYRFLINLLGVASITESYYLFWIALFSSIYAGSLALRQLDMKKMLAYSSISHMNIAIIGLFTGDYQGIRGSFFLMVGHGLVASALFILVGILYERYSVRLLNYYGALSEFMPKYNFFLFYFILSNFSFPGTANFIGEILIFTSIVFISKLLFIGVLVSTFISVIYSLLLYLKISGGVFKKWFISVYYDLSLNEFLSLFSIFLFSIYLGLWPKYLFTLIECDIFLGLVCQMQYLLKILVLL